MYNEIGASFWNTSVKLFPFAETKVDKSIFTNAFTSITFKYEMRVRSVKLFIRFFVLFREPQQSEWLSLASVWYEMIYFKLTTHGCIWLELPRFFTNHKSTATIKILALEWILGNHFTTAIVLHYFSRQYHSYVVQDYWHECTIAPCQHYLLGGEATLSFSFRYVYLLTTEQRTRTCKYFKDGASVNTKMHLSDIF